MYFTVCSSHNWQTELKFKRNFVARCFARTVMWEGGLGDQGRGHSKQGNPLRMNLIPGATRLKRKERRTILSFAKLKWP